MKFADRLRVSTSATSTATITMGAAPAGYRTLAQAIADGDLVVGDTGVFFVIEDAVGNFEESYFTITNSTTLTRESVYRSSNNNAAVTFPAGAKTVFNSVPAEYLRGTAAADVPAMSSVTDTTRLLGITDAGELRTVTAAVYKAYATGGTPPADVTAPTLSSPAGSPTGTTTASGTVSTNDASGTLYYLFSTSSTATATAVKAGSSKTVTATGSQSVAATGLTASTTYYVHYLHRDAAGNDSAVASSASFTTAAAGDVTAPTLSSPTGSQTGSTTASGSVSTNEANGTLYRYASTNSTETAATIKTANLTSTVSATGVQNVTFTGLNPSTTYYAHYVHRDAAGNDSAVASSASFTTTAATATGVTMTGPTGGAVSVASTNFTIGVTPVGGTITGTVVVTPSDNGGGGTFSPTSVSLTTASPTATFTYTPSSTAGARTISVTNNGGLSNPANITYTSTAAANAGPHTFTPYTAGVTFKTTIARSEATNTYASLVQFAPGKATTPTAGTYWNFSPNAPAGSTVMSGWSNSSTVPPAETTQNASGNTSQNGYVAMYDRPDPAWQDLCNLWAPAGSGSGPWYFWIRVDNYHYCLNAGSGLMVT